MKFTIAQIGTNRLQKVLLTNKGQDPSQIINALKSDLQKILESYLDDFEIDISTSKTNSITQFDIVVLAKRIKSFGTLPY